MKESSGLGMHEGAEPSTGGGGGGGGGAGGRISAAELLPLVYDQLRSLAASYIDRERPGHTLQPTALVHEAYLRMARARTATVAAADTTVGVNVTPTPDTDASGGWADQAHFLAVAAVAMRNGSGRSRAPTRRGQTWRWR